MSFTIKTNPFFAALLAMSVAGCAITKPTAPDMDTSLTEPFRLTALVNQGQRQLALCAIMNSAGSKEVPQEHLEFRAAYRTDHPYKTMLQADALRKYFSSFPDNKATVDPSQLTQSGVEILSDPSHENSLVRVSHGDTMWTGEQSRFQTRIVAVEKKNATSAQDDDAAQKQGRLALLYLLDVQKTLQEICGAVDGRDALEGVKLPEGWSVVFRIDGKTASPESVLRALENTVATALDISLTADAHLPPLDQLVSERDGTLRAVPTPARKPIRGGHRLGY